MNRTIYRKDLSDWDNNALFYKVEAGSPFKKILREEIVHNFTIQKNSKILDLGAGIGDIANDLSKKFNAQITCIDFSLRMRKEAIRIYPDLKYFTRSAHKLPFNNGSFDVVIALGIFHHLKVQGILPESLQEIRRVLIKGGMLCYLDRSSSIPADHFEKILHSLKNIFNKTRANHAVSSTSSESSLDSKDVDLIESLFLPIKRTSIYSMPFKFLMVISNTLYYSFGEKAYYSFQYLTFPLAYIFEKCFNFRIWETEYCQIVRKK